MFEHLDLLWMDIWLHNCTVTTTDVSPHLGELAEILSDVSVQTMPLQNGWGCRTFQTASHTHVFSIKCLSNFNCCRWAYGCTLTHYHHRCVPRFGRVGWILSDEGVETISLQNGWGARTFQTASNIHVIHMKCLSTLNCCAWPYGCKLTPLKPRMIW